MSWNYANLSKAAKAVGGPEALIEILVQSGKKKMVPWVVFFGFVGVGTGICVIKAIEFFGNRKNVSELDVEIAKKKIVQGVNEYDAMHSEITKE